MCVVIAAELSSPGIYLQILTFIADGCVDSPMNVSLGASAALKFFKGHAGLKTDAAVMQYRYVSAACQPPAGSQLLTASSQTRINHSAHPSSPLNCLRNTYFSWLKSKFNITVPTGAADMPLEATIYSDMMDNNSMPVWSISMSTLNPAVGYRVVMAKLKVGTPQHEP